MKKFAQISDDNLVETLAGAQPRSQHAFEIQMEIQQRTMLAQIETAQAQERAANATIEAANAGKRTARWTTVSGVAIAVSAAATVVLVLLTYLQFKA